MDLIEILILLAFILFPAIQALLEKMGGGRRPELPPELDPDHREEPPVATMDRSEAGGARRTQSPLEESGWSAGWGEWQSETLEELSAEDVVSEGEAEEILALQEDLSDNQISEAARVTVPIVSMEALKVDRAREHRRFHQGVEAVVPARRRPGNPLAAALRDETDLRRAILLSEVLGPPRSLRPVESPQPV